MEALVVRVRSLPEASAEARRAEQALLLSVRGFVVGVAQDVARKMNVPVEDLAQEGMLAVARSARKFQPGRAEGRCLFPAYAMRIARQAMMKWAVSELSPVQISRWARRRVKKAKAQAKADGRSVEDVLRSMKATDAAIAVLGHGSIQAGVSPEVLLRAADPSASADGHALREDALDKLGPVFARLPKPARWLLKASYGLGHPEALTDRAIAAQMGMSVEEVNQAREEALAKLRRKMDGR